MCFAAVLVVMSDNRLMLSIPIEDFRYEPPVYARPLGVVALGVAEEYSDKGRSYWRYLVSVDNQPKNYRRYSEFEWLRSTLIRAFPGCCIPTLPDKEGLSVYWKSHGREFLKYRRHGLEQFLQFCSEHPSLSTSEHFLSFLEDDEFKFASKAKHTQGGGYLSYLSELGGSIVNSVSKYVYGVSEGVVTQDQELFAQEQTWLQHRALNEHFSEQARTLVTRLIEESESNVALSRAYGNLAEVETGDLKKQLLAFKEGHVKVADNLLQAKTLISDLFEEQLEHSLRITRGVIEAFERRNEAAERVQKLRAVGGEQANLVISERVLQEISSQLRSDTRGLHELRGQVLAQVEAKYISVQAALAQKAEVIWREVNEQVVSP